MPEEITRISKFKFTQKINCWYSNTTAVEDTTWLFDESPNNREIVPNEIFEFNFIFEIVKPLFGKYQPKRKIVINNYAESKNEISHFTWHIPRGLSVVWHFLPGLSLSNSHRQLKTGDSISS